MAENKELCARFVKAKRVLFDRLYESFNDRQKEAIFAVDGPLLVLAGAGSGKTTVLVSRIAQIVRYGNAYEDEKMPCGVTEEDVARLENGRWLEKKEMETLLAEYPSNPCPPYAILAITFTNKAANEMKSRLALTLGEETASEIWAGTFHSICVRILRRFGASVGVPQNFTIYDTDDSKKVLSACVQRLNLDEKVFTPKSVMNVISRAKDRLLEPADLLAGAANDYMLSKCAEIYQLYDEQLRASSALDFDDIIKLTVKLLKEDESVREFYRKKFRYICVDEYQDTNKAQFELARLLCNDACNLMVVGDDDQSIYRFRGATIENILRFDSIFENTRVVKLEQNYRSSANILDAANGIIGHNEGRHSKKLWCDKDKGEKLTLKRLENQNDEARYIINKISAQTGKSGDRSFSDFAVLYRMNAQSNALENAFARSGIPYRILGGTRFYERKEIKDVIAYLCVVNNPADDLRLMRIINEPKRKIGASTVSALEQLARVEGCSMFEIMERAEGYPALSKAASKLQGFCGLIRSLQNLANTQPLPVLFEKTIEDSGYMAMLLAEGIGEIDRLENVRELVSNAVEYAEKNQEATLDGFLEEVALINDIDKYDENADAVVLMTVHSAKGLEFPVVFLPGLEEGIFPGMAAASSPKELEEERRLAYVAVTRAKEKVFLTHARERMLFGHTQYNQLSRFVKEIPEELISDETEQGYNRARTIANRKEELMNSARSHVLGQEKSAPVIKRADLGERFVSGDRVVHTTFGGGSVIAGTPMGADVLYEIEFDTVGRKKLMGSYARLKRE
ncbi:MAG: UvrD-helicase domain-containing protein [Clostridia bacterium]|nr:UvrD-helicase domain-containing protein [Clostridia bacterium]